MPAGAQWFSHLYLQFCLLKSRLIYSTAYSIALIGRHLKLNMLKTSGSLPTHYSYVSSTVFPSHLMETSSSQLLSLKTLVILDSSCSYHTSDLSRNVFKIYPIISLRLLHISLVMIYNVASFGLLHSSPNISPCSSLVYSQSGKQSDAFVSRSCHSLLKVLGWLLITMVSKGRLMRKTDPMTYVLCGYYMWQ